MRDNPSRPPPRRDKTKPPIYARTPSDHVKNGQSRHWLPVLPTRFIGRDDEIAAVQSLLQRVDVRLLTLIGPPGIGKTRLALEVATAVAPNFKHRAAFVDLAPISDPALVPHTIAQVLGVVDAPRRNTLKRLIEYLEEKRILLVLDNFEHIIGAATQVSELLAACSGVKVLATSREPLHLTWEREIPVSPLRLPDLARLPELEALLSYSAVALFLERARAIRSDFTLTPQNAAAVAEICVRLDGLPLAIEMAAARIKSLTPEALAHRLDDRLGLLTAGARDVPERQRTLRSAIAWSNDLLKPAEQELFRRLSVFAGGCTADAAQAVFGGDLEINVTEGLGALVDKSLVRHESRPDGSSRFSLLESLREFGRGQLATTGELETIQHRHAAYFVALVHQAEVHKRGIRQSTWLETLEREHANIQGALGWCLDGGNVALGLQGATALSWFWDLRGHWSIGRRWLERLLNAYSTTHDSLRAKGLCALGYLLWHQAEFEQAQVVFEESLAMYRRLGETIGIINALYSLSLLFQWREEYAKADAAIQEGLALSRGLNDAAGISEGLLRLGNVAINRGEFEAGTACLRDALRVTQEHGLEGDRGIILYSLGRAGFWQGELDRAASFFDECLAIFHEVDFKWDIGRTVVRLGDLAVVRGEVESAAHLYEEGFAYLHELGDTRWAARATHGLGTLSLRRGEYGEAHALLLESLRRFYEFGARLEVAECLESTAALAASIDQPELAARLTGAMDSLRETIGAPLPPVYRPQHDRMVSLLRRRLGPSAFAGAYAAGRAMTLEQAAAEAITLTIKPTRPSMSRKPALSLTRREHEVAALIAQGLTNRRIAAALFITDHTVESHVENILNKLGFNARTQIAAWASASENRPAPAL